MYCRGPESLEKAFTVGWQTSGGKDVSWILLDNGLHDFLLPLLRDCCSSSEVGEWPWELLDLMGLLDCEAEAELAVWPDLSWRDIMGHVAMVGVLKESLVLLSN
jgi:hypothetical protein